MAGNQNIVPLDTHPRARNRAAQGPTAGSLDLLAQLFDHLGADGALPAAVRSEIARLRMPSLRAAQLVPDFLNRRAHPARRLLDAVGAATLGLDASATDEDATVVAIAAAVHDLLVDFDLDDLAPFEAAAARLEGFVTERTRAEDDDARVLVQAIVRREMAELPARVAAEEVARRLRSRLWVPEPVRTMLSAHWVRALAAEHTAHGEGAPGWHVLVRTMDELLWSVEPKATAEGRRRLAETLPALVKSLDEGLRRAQVSDAERDEFLSRLVDCHAQAMKAGLRGMSIVPEVAAAEASHPAIARATFAVGDRRVEEVRLAAAHTAAPDQADEAVSRLRVGAWIELERGARAAARKRLSWSSPMSGACLFIGIGRESTGIAIAPDALAEQLRRGEARIVDDAPLTERALTSMLARMSPT